jgi:hypothetical protein
VYCETLTPQSHENVAAVPVRIEPGAGAVKLAGTPAGVEFTSKDAFAERLAPPVPTTVSTEEPAWRFGGSVTVSIVVPEPATCDLAKLALAPGGNPATLVGLKVTVPLKPFIGFTLTPNVAKPVAPTLWDDGEIVK